MTGALFWINKDVSSGTLSNSSKSQRSAVQSQIQRGRPRKRRQRVRVEQDKITQELERPKELYDVSSRSMSATLDPFNSASAKIDPTAHGLLRYYVYYMHPAMWPNEPMSMTGAYAYKSSIVRIMETAVQDRLMMFCLLISATCRIQYVDYLSFRNVARKENEYSHTALQLMKARVDQKVAQPTWDNQALLQCIAFLMSAESYRNNFAASRTHLQAALNILDQQIGGIQNLQHQHLQGQFLMADLYLSCIEVKPCICNCFYDPGPASVLHLQQNELSDSSDVLLMGSAILKHISSVIPTELMNLIQAVLETYRVKATLHKAGMPSKRIMDVSHWITYRNMAIRNKLLALQHSDPRTDALRVTLIMWTLLAMNITGRVKTVKLMSSNLQSILLRIPCKTFHCDAYLRLWILLVGFGCSPEGSELARWFVKQIRDMETIHTMTVSAEVLERELVDVLVDFQKGYFYHDAIQRPLTCQLVEQLRK